MPGRKEVEKCIGILR